MADALEATTAPVPLSDGTAIESGQAAPAAPEGSTGEPRPSSTDQPGQPESKPEPKRLWQDLDSAERDYKALQAQFTRLTQTLSKHGVRSLGEAEDRLQLLQELSGNPAFLDWARSQLAAQATGSEHADPETQRALEVVEQLIETRLAPFRQAQAFQRAQDTVKQLEGRYGAAVVTALKPQMFELLKTYKERGWVSPTIEESFDYDFVEGLFLAAAGRDPEFAAKQHQKRLEQKRAATTVNEPGAPASMVAEPTKPMTMADAYAAARRQLGQA